MKKVVVGLSGGVDSAVSAYLLKMSGFDVKGIYLKMHKSIPNEQNIKRVKKIAKLLDIEYEIRDIEKEFNSNVYDYFIKSYIKGITPNPCVICNATIKFGEFFNIAKKEADFVATGHYAKKDENFFYKADDLNKDQSYFLALVDKSKIKDIIFPLQNYKKDKIKEIAKEIEILEDINNYKDSQEICFVKDSYVDILKEHIEVDKEGLTYNLKGEIVGNHKGYMHYTIGKRRGFFVKGAHVPHYVLDLDAKNNSIIVGTKEDLKIKKVTIDNINLFIEPKEKIECEVKLRYRSNPIKAILTIKDNIGVINLQEYAYGVANGQIAAFYDKDKLIGGGIIVDKE